MAHSVQTVIVDDTDSQISYSGSGWMSNSTGVAHDTNPGSLGLSRTLHATRGGDSLVFLFLGSTIQVFGTIDSKATQDTTAEDDTLNPWECFINGTSIGSFKPSRFHQNNQVLCGTNALSDGQHELTMKSDMKLRTMRKVLWFDYIEYTPTQDSENFTSVIVNNTDPRFEYSADWQDDGQTKVAHTHDSSVRFNFTGMQLTWVGTIPDNLPNGESSGSFTIDGNGTEIFSLVGLPSEGDSSKFNQIFFTTPQLIPGNHTIVVKYNGNPGLTPLTLDYVYLNTSAINNTVPPAETSHVILAASTSTPLPQLPSKVSIGPQSSRITSSSAPSSSIVSPSTTSSHPTLDPSPPPASASSMKMPQSDESKSVPLGALAGGIVGGLTFIAAVILIFLLYSHRRRRCKIVPFRNAGQPNSPDNEDAVMILQRSSASRHPGGSSRASRSILGSVITRSIIGAGAENNQSNPSVNVVQVSSASGYVSGARAQIGDSKRRDGFVAPISPNTALFDIDFTEAVASSETPPTYSTHS